jgi:hypothetical protein
VVVSEAGSEKTAYKADAESHDASWHGGKFAKVSALDQADTEVAEGPGGELPEEMPAWAGTAQPKETAAVIEVVSGKPAEGQAWESHAAKQETPATGKTGTLDVVVSEAGSEKTAYKADAESHDASWHGGKFAKVSALDPSQAALPVKLPVKETGGASQVSAEADHGHEPMALSGKDLHSTDWLLDEQPFTVEASHHPGQVDHGPDAALKDALFA